MTDIVERADVFRLGVDPTPDDVNEANWIIDRMTAEIERLRAAPKVKPLEWDGRGTTGVMLQYRIHIGYGLMNGVFALTLSGSTIGEFDSEEAAKAAAQADYERRILSALTQEGEGNG
ncbi:hypothetical protein [Maritimibacter sp. UBA3975]|uniref:hypothetical protein n=1 Tax=Maritimibacter sp. UBA3975 TaxID=1946833 RepID=UPI000C0978CD|nr:hypothetical protein [Maritimibacter sp. UBA3975]MAM60819.1 hypothetical protein [Maritimibacter sp.]|tara:strand:+ start:11650 stop:12003 length:354 start_codon:yes stop_codon:yes gene_type:complete